MNQITLITICLVPSIFFMWFLYKQDKVGTIAIYRNYDKTTLTLVTCTNYESTTQTIYIAELQEITEA